MKKIFILFASVLALGVLAGCSNDAGTVTEAPAGSGEAKFEAKGGKKGAMESEAGLKAPSSSGAGGG